MEIANQKILVIGLAVSGMSTVNILHGLGAQVKVNDRKTQDKLQKAAARLKSMGVEYLLGGHPVELAAWPDFAVISPGVPMDIPMVQAIKRRGKEVISEVEMAYRLTCTPMIAITGTNGKTTTTALTGEIFSLSGRKAHVVGNIGAPVIEVATNSKPEDILIAEISSFQLEGIRDFKPVTSAILNITPDHLDRHKTFDNYVEVKAKIFENQNDGECVILNADDPYTARLAGRCRAKVLHISRRDILENGAFVEGEHIIVKKGKKTERVCRVSKLKIRGDHNIENALAATAMAWSMDVPLKTVGDALAGFEGVEHRLEYVDTVNSVVYINDSKGTNPDASIKAVKAIDKQIVLIAGGYDKGGEFDGFVDGFEGKVKGVVLIGATAKKIQKSCQRKNINNIYIAEDMHEAVTCAASIAAAGDTVLLSPACASWDMYNSFEERGQEFKKAVGLLRRI
jgi:UDP-N-acetylmuramoylalanine--D-glutamate ligase